MLSAEHSGNPVKVRVGRIITIFKPFNLYLVSGDYKGCPFRNKTQTPLVDWYMAGNIEDIFSSMSLYTVVVLS